MMVEPTVILLLNQSQEGQRGRRFASRPRDSLSSPTSTPRQLPANQYSCSNAKTHSQFLFPGQSEPADRSPRQILDPTPVNSDVSGSMQLYLLLSHIQHRRRCLPSQKCVGNCFKAGQASAWSFHVSPNPKPLSALRPGPRFLAQEIAPQRRR